MTLLSGSFVLDLDGHNKAAARISIACVGVESEDSLYVYVLTLLPCRSLCGGCIRLGARGVLVWDRSSVWELRYLWQKMVWTITFYFNFFKTHYDRQLLLGVNNIYIYIESATSLIITTPFPLWDPEILQS